MLAAGRASHDRRAARIAGAAGYAGGAVVDEAAVAEGEARGVPGKDGACARSFFEASLRTQRELLHLPPSRPASLETKTLSSTTMGSGISAAKIAPPL